MPPAGTLPQYFRPYVAATLAACLMGLMGVFVRHISLSAETIAFARFGLGFLFLIGFLLYGGRFRQLSLRLSIYPIMSGVFIAFCVLFYIKAITLTALANAAFLLYLGPLLAVAVTTVFLGERLSLASGLLILSAFLGCALLLGFDLDASASALRGSVFGVVSALFYALFIVTNRLIPGEVTPLTRSFYQLLVGAITLAPFAKISLEGIVSWRSEAFWIIAMGFFQGFLAVTLMIFSIGYLKAYQYGTISYLEPVVASLAGLVLYDETITLQQALGGILILSSGVTQILLAVKDTR
jgi:drug/metabolite transporter (DMT)-like permease